MDKNTRYLVTGAAGFIGSHLVEALIQRGAYVRGVDNFINSQPENIAPFRNHFEFLEGDLLDDTIREQSVKGIDVILHQAALGSVPRSLDDPIATHRNGAHLTLLLLDSARRAGVRRFLFASSSSVYGDTPTLPKVESMLPDPRSPYAAGKAACEHYVLAFARGFGMQNLSLRYFNVFGPRQNPNSPYSAVIAKFCKAYCEGGSLTVHGDGSQSRDFTYVENVIQANLRAAESPTAWEGQVINVACGERHSLNEMIEILNRLSGVEKFPAYGSPRLGDVRHSLADITRARTLLGYAPIVTFESGLARTLEWRRMQNSAL